MHRDRNIVIVGGGIIGCTSAYFLTRHPQYDPQRHKITLIEASSIAGGASGKAGGLLGLWAYPSCIVPLSFKLHAELAAEHQGEKRWGYRRMNAGSLEARGRSMHIPRKADKQESTLNLHKRDGLAQTRRRGANVPADLNWIAGECRPEWQEMGTPDDTAQVHPYLFTTAMAQLAQEAGVEIIHGSVIDIKHQDGRVQGVTYKDKVTGQSVLVPATDIIVAAGPWTQRVFKDAPISAMRAHSVTIRPAQPISAYALFTEIQLPSDFGMTDTFVKAKSSSSRQKIVSPEIYARPNNEAYVCGEGDTLVPLPDLSSEVETDDRRCQDIIDYVSTISDELRDGQVTVRQACYLPSVQSAKSRGPLIGKTHIQGLLIAAGHTCWGIQNGPATGKLMSEFVFDGCAKSADVTSLDPRLALR